MTRAMIMLPDGSIVDRVLAEDDDITEKLIDTANGSVAIRFDNGDIYSTHWSNVWIIRKSDDQGDSQ